MPKKFALKPRSNAARGQEKRKSEEKSNLGVIQDGQNDESVSSYDVSSQALSVQDRGILPRMQAQGSDGSKINPSLKKPMTKRPAKKGEKLSLESFQNLNKVKEMREKTMLRDNWNYFVNDDDSKTDAVLRFKKPHIKNLYEKHLVASSAYSMRILLGLATISYIYLVDMSECKYNWRFLCYTNYPLSIFLISLSFFCTFPNFGQLFINYGVAKWISMYHASILLINVVPYYLSLQFINYYISNYQQKLEIISNLSELASETENLKLKNALETQVLQIEIILWVIVLMQHLPVLIINLSLVTDWIEYVVTCYVIFFIHCLNFWSKSQAGFRRDYFYKFSIVLSFTVIIFASYEKVRKELFIIYHTNSKTKKQMMKFFSQSPPCLIMEKDGSIKLCNESFEYFVNETCKVRFMPKDFYKFIQADEKASEKFVNIMKLRQSKVQTEYEEPEFEIFFDKLALKQANDPEEKKEDEGVSEQIAEGYQDNILDLESQSSIRQYDAPKEPNSNFHDQFVAFKITVTPVNYKSRMCFMINFENISESKSKLRLLSLHARLIGKFQFNNQKRMENLHKQLVDNNQEDIAEMVGEFLGNSQVTLNMIQQMNLHLNNLSNLQPNKIENYNLSEEIDFCIDGLTASKWEKEIEIYLTKGELP